MSAILTTILPVFGLIALGFIAARGKFIGTAAAQGMSQFAFNLAMPALLFRAVASVGPQTSSPWPLWIAMFGGIAIVWLVTALITRATSVIDASPSSAAMGACFGNIAMLGVPLSIAHFGDAVAFPASIILSVHAPVLWLAATIQMEAERQGKGPSVRIVARELSNSLIRNPIVIAVVAGVLWRATGLGLHPIPDRFLDLLGGAGIPTALVALGLSLAAYGLRGQMKGITVMLILKMLLLPLVVWLIARFAFDLEPLWTRVAVLLAAMPTGVNAYLFAQRYSSGTAAISGVIALGTALSLISVTVLLILMDSGLV
jgi:malonate transporter and related proteins